MFQGLAAVFSLALLAGCSDVRSRLAADRASPSRDVELAAQGAPVAGGEYRLQAAHSGKCVGVSGSAPGVWLTQQGCDNAAAQMFSFKKVTVGGAAFYQLRTQGGLCVDVVGGRQTDGEHLQQWRCQADPTVKGNQLFELRQATSDSSTLVAKHSGKCLDVSNLETRDGASIIQWTCSGGANQRFKLLGASGGGGGGSLPAPPATIVDNIRDGNPTVKRVYYDDEIAVYFGDGMDPGVNWMFDHIRQSWQYIKKTYGSFGPDPRIYIVAHRNPAFDGSDIRSRFDDGFGYRNTVDLGGTWDLKTPRKEYFGAITRELSRIVEAGGKDVRESPTYDWWGVGPFAGIFTYDAYKAIGKADWAASYLDRVRNEEPVFEKWVYPLYTRYDGIKVFNKYFGLLAQCFPKDDTEADGQPAKVYGRRASPGEILHFFSGATGANLKDLYTKAFGWNAQVEAQFKQAQQDFSCAGNYPR